MLELVSPFPLMALSLAYEWLQEFPLSNFDDYGPKTLAAFVVEMEQRSKVERTWGVLSEGELCGMVAYLPLTPRLGTFHGICFSKRVHGTGVASEAVSRILAELFASGVEKVQAGYFADNLVIARFLAGIGFVQEGLLCKQTVRGGEAIDMRLVALFKEDFMKHQIEVA